MKKLPATAGVLAVLFAASPTAATPANDNRAAAQAAQTSRLRAKIVLHRKMTWHWQDRAHHRRSDTQHRERRAKLPTLRRLAFYWEHRHYLAWKRWKEAQRPVYVAPASTSSIDSCLQKIIEREGSGGDPHATNPSSGAYGIPQALPGSKMASAGADWADNPATQIRWMIGYVNSRYGGSCAALAHSYSYGWY